MDWRSIPQIEQDQTKIGTNKNFLLRAEEFTQDTFSVKKAGKPFSILLPFDAGVHQDYAEKITASLLVALLVIGGLEELGERDAADEPAVARVKYI